MASPLTLHYDIDGHPVLAIRGELPALDFVVQYEPVGTNGLDETSADATPARSRPVCRRRVCEGSSTSEDHIHASSSLHEVDIKISLTLSKPSRASPDFLGALSDFLAVCEGFLSAQYLHDERSRGVKWRS
jgi:hypothetical protein